MTMKPVLAYWDIRGLGQPIRYLLEYLKVDFENKQYACGPAPDFDRSHWLDAKPTLGLDFPNLPYYIDDEVKLTQTHAIMKHLARKHDASLLGKTLADQALVDMLANQVMDSHVQYYGGAYVQGAKKEEFADKFREKMTLFAKFLGDKTWFMGDYLTFPDLHMYEVLELYDNVIPGIVAEFPTLKAFWQRVRDIPQIKAYLASNRFQASPINNKMAQWGN